MNSLSNQQNPDVPDSVRVYFADLTHTGCGINANCFPLGIGLVAAYATVERTCIQAEIFKFPNDLNEALINQLPQILCLSNYAWNSSLAILFARRVKEIDPSVVIVMGGPNFPLDKEGRKQFLEANDAIDFYIRWDGEKAFVSLFDRLRSCGFETKKIEASDSEDLPNSSYLVNGEYIEGKDDRVTNLAEIPSPYTMGMFDSLFEHQIVPLIETTRGCPYSCTFCNDGNKMRSKIYRRERSVLREELEYIAAKPHTSTQLFMSDLNFGMYEEDIETAGILRDVMVKFGWPNRVESSVGKSHPERIRIATNTINSAVSGAFKFGASFQSTDVVVLKNILRKNVPFEKLRDVVKTDGEADEQFAEIILGLPGDSTEKHFQSLTDVIDKLSMNNVDMHQLTLLQGTEMALPYQRDLYEVETRFRVFTGCVGMYEVLGETFPCAEFEEIVVSNSTMSWEDYLDCRVMNLCVKTFYDHETFREIFAFIRHLGLSQFDLLRYLSEQTIPHNEKLNALITNFKKANSAFLFETRALATEFIANAENAQKYVDGEFGLNEIVHYRAEASLANNEVIHEAFADATIAYLEANNALTPEREIYIREVVEFCRLRKCNPLDVESVHTAKFHFNFPKISEHDFAIEPSDFKIAPITMSFYHDPGSLDLLNEMLNVWGAQSGAQVGKMLQRANLMLFDKKWNVVSDHDKA